MFHRSVLLLVLLCFTLSACVNLAERRAKRDARNMAADKAQCSGLGFEPNTDGYRLCLMNLKMKREADIAASQSCIMNGGTPLASGSCLQPSYKRDNTEDEKEELCQKMGKQLVGDVCM